MSTLAFAAAGNVIAPGIGGFIGAAIGSYIDQVFLFPPPDQKGPRLDSLQLSSSSEGTDVNFCLGSASRVSGEYIFASKLKEKKKKSGKGGPSATNYTYSSDVAIGFCEGTISRVLKIWANGTLIYDDDPDITVVSTLVDAVKITVKKYIGSYETDYVDVIYTEIVSPSTGPDLTQFHTGVDIVVSGWSTTGNNGTFRVFAAWRDDATGETYIRYKNPLAVTDSGGETVTLFQDIPKFSEEDFASITIYQGTDTQLPNSLIQSHARGGLAPGYRGLAYVVLEGFQLTKKFGNSLPQVQALIEQSATPLSIGDAIKKICLRSKLSEALFDTSAVTGNIVGYHIRGPQNIDDQLRPLLLAYDILQQEDNGVLKFFNRANAEVVELTTDELVAHEGEEDAARPIETTDRRAQQVAAIVHVNYSDPSVDHNQGSQNDVRNKFVTGYSVTVDLGNVVLTAIEAKTIARRVLWTGVANAKTQRLQLGPRRLDILENDIVSVRIDNNNYRILLTQVDQGQNGVNLLEGINEVSTTLSYDNVIAEDAEDPNGATYIPPEMFSVFLDLPPLQDAQLDEPGFYFATTTQTPELPFHGASLFSSPDGGANYTSIMDILSESTIGYCTTTLGTATYGYTDNKNTLRVELFSGELASATRLQVLSGINWALVGNEIIGFEVATLVSDRTYDISVLIRGLRSTDDKMSGHLAGEVFVLLEAGALNFEAIQQSRINSIGTYKCLSSGQLIGSVTAESFTPRANNLRPFSPCQVKSVRDSGTLALTLTWVRRTRAPVRLLGGTGIPLEEQSEVYEIDILNAAETTVQGSIVVTAALTTTISDATLMGYGYASGVSIHLRIYQKSAIVGRGKGRLVVT